jgi:predicted TIM-barrel fold metal-dependent hydrolase
MIIDIHSHLFVKEWLPREFWEGIVKTGQAQAKRIMKADITFDEMEKIVLQPLWDSPEEALLAEMEAAGMDKTVILPQDFEIGLSKTEVTIEEQNRLHAECMKKHPDRVIAFAGIDPRRKGSVEFLEKCIKEWGLRRLKLHPAAGFFPNDRRFYPLYQKCADLKITVLFHSGPIIYPLRSQPAHPIYLDDVAADFPDLTIIAAHMSHTWWQDLLAIAAVKPNIFVDISGWELEAMAHYEDFCRILKRFTDELGYDRILFGTDGPGFRQVCPPRDYVQLIRGLPQKSPEGIKFTEEEISAILGGNAQRILNL